MKKSQEQNFKNSSNFFSSLASVFRQCAMFACRGEAVEAARGGGEETSTEDTELVPGQKTRSAQSERESERESGL